MTTKVDICNLALSMLGDPAEVVSIEPPDGGDQAGHCAQWYPIAVRKVFESCNWSFAERFSTLTEFKNIDPATLGWRHAFQLPSESVRLVDVRGKHGNSIEYQVIQYEDGKTNVLFCNDCQATIRYISHLNDPSIFPIYFVEVVVISLAMYLVGALKRQDVSVSTFASLQKLYEQALVDAKTKDAAVSRRSRNHEMPSSHQRARWI